MDADSQHPSESVDQWPLSRLRDLHLELGHQCNVRCRMCYQTDFDQAPAGADRMWNETLVPAYEVARRLTLTGGEPTVLAAARSLIQMVNRRFPNLRLNIATNGILFSGIWQDVFLEQGNYVNFSINAVDADLYRKIVQFGRFETVVANIDQLVERRRTSGSSCLIRISAVIYEDTIPCLPDFVLWAAEHGLDGVLLSADHLGHFGKHDPHYVQEMVRKTYELADHHPDVRVIHLDDLDWYYARLHGLEPVRPRQMAGREDKPCPVAFDTLYVGTDGAARACCKSWCVFGNLMKQSVEEVWNSRVARGFRSRMMKLDFRDCLVSCDLNCRPVHPRVALLRRGYWAMRRDPRTVVKKVIRKVGLTSAQMKPKTEQDREG